VGIFSSAERKARETAAPLGRALGLAVRVRPGLGENERSATGYLPGAEFEATADRFFAQPEASIRGWERAVDAQARIVAAVAAALAEAPPGEVAIVAHGGVGALLRCHLACVAITRAEDQPPGGGGHLFGFDRATGRLLGPWRRIEDRA
jgi:broad specificity phosphatase PhoE